jgi:ABC-type Na+ efflux pump permease subunit
VGFTLLALQQVNLNQFGLDRAGLTLQLLAPVSDRDLVLGKAAGGALLAASSALLCIVPAALIAPGGSPWLWLAVAACGAWGYLMLAPLAAILSALFPKRADLSKLGRAGNPHAAAEILGFLFLAVLPIPPAATMGLALVLTESPALAFAIAAGWAVVAALLSLPLFRLAVRLVAARRENLAMVAERG